MFGLFKKKVQCPKCDSFKIKTVKSSWWKRQQEASLQLLTFGIRKPTSPLNVCRSCGFSWENR